MRKLGFTPNKGEGPLTIQKRPGYNVILNQRLSTNKGKKIVKSTSVTCEERPLEPASKRRKMIREEEYQVE